MVFRGSHTFATKALRLDHIAQQANSFVIVLCIYLLLGQKQEE